MSVAAHRARRARHGLLAACIVASLGVAACTAVEEPPPPATGSTAATGTSEATPPAVDLLDRLLRVDDIRPMAALGLDLREQPVLDPQQFALATLRGPCGAVVDTPFAEAGVFRVFRSTVALVVEAVAQPGPEAAATFVEQLEADADVGCAPFVEQLGSAEPSTLTLEGMLDLSALGDGWVGWTQEVTASTGRVGYRAVLVAAEGDRLWLLAVLSPNPIAPEALVALGEAASERARTG